jgi:hypothetical protein
MSSRSLKVQNLARVSEVCYCIMGAWQKEELQHRQGRDLRQGALTDGEGSVQLTSSLRHLVMYKRKTIFSILK